MPAITRKQDKLAKLGISLEKTLLFQRREEELEKQIRSLQRKLNTSEKRLQDEKARRQRIDKRRRRTTQRVLFANARLGRLVSKLNNKPLKQSRNAHKSIGADTTKTTSGRITKRGQSKGMANPGFLCYRNSILQCLLSQPKYCELLQRVHTDCDKGETDCVSCSLKHMVSAYWSPECKENPHRTIGRSLNQALLRCIPKDDQSFGKDLHAKMQLCPFDFLKFGILQQLCGGDHLTVNADAAFINPIFQVDTFTQWTCKYSGITGDHNPEAEFGIDVPVIEPERGLPLVLYLRQNYFQLKVRFSCGCQGCTDNVTTGTTTTGKEELVNPEQVQRRTIVRGPEILVLRIMRYTYEYNMETHGQDEVTCDERIPYDELLDLSEFTHDGKELKYRLDGVVSHQGESVHSGHYISHVREGDQAVEFNDQTRVAITGESVGRALTAPEEIEDNEDFKPFVLVYSKI